MLRRISGDQGLVHIEGVVVPDGEVHPVLGEDDGQGLEGDGRRKNKIVGPSFTVGLELLQLEVIQLLPLSVQPPCIERIAAPGPAPVVGENTRLHGDHAAVFNRRVQIEGRGDSAGAGDGQILAQAAGELRGVVFPAQRVKYGSGKPGFGVLVAGLCRLFIPLVGLFRVPLPGGAFFIDGSDVDQHILVSGLRRS